jgi:hypothetical protein
MKGILKLEELGMFILSLWTFHTTELSWWWFAGLFFLPDLGMIGYLITERLGAWIYNVFHHKGIAMLLWAAGFYLQLQSLEALGIILFSHSSFDRMLGYGLKHEKGFKFTHLGQIGKP